MQAREKPLLHCSKVLVYRAALNVPYVPCIQWLIECFSVRKHRRQPVMYKKSKNGVRESSMMVIRCNDVERGPSLWLGPAMITRSTFKLLVSSRRRFTHVVADDIFQSFSASLNSVYP